MLTLEENEALTRVGPGTPMGKLMRWYWHPIAAASQLDENPVKRITLLGETLTLYRDKRGNLGLVGDRCAHRRVALVFGIPEEEGIRCPYHGWRYDETGQCVEQPAEPADSTFKDRVQIVAYPVQELAGLIFAYLGPEPAPLLPRWDLFAMENVVRDIGFMVLPCNWLQMQENDLDPAHLEWLHGYFSNYALERVGRPDLMRRRADPQSGGRARIGAVVDWREWKVYEQGIMNMELGPNGAWHEHRPSLFPNMNSFSTEFMYRVPMDDTHTMHVFFTSYPRNPEEAFEPQTSVPYYFCPPSVDEDGLPIWNELDSNGGQDAMAWIAQGGIVNRNAEHLGTTDKGIIVYRELLARQLKIVEDGGEPMNVFRDPEQNVSINVPPRGGEPLKWTGPYGRSGGPYKHSPIVTEMAEKYLGKEVLRGPVH